LTQSLKLSINLAYCINSTGLGDTVKLKKLKSNHPSWKGNRVLSLESIWSKRSFFWLPGTGR